MYQGLFLRTSIESTDHLEICDTNKLVMKGSDWTREECSTDSWILCKNFPTSLHAPYYFTQRGNPHDSVVTCEIQPTYNQLNCLTTSSLNLQLFAPDELYLSFDFLMCFHGLINPYTPIGKYKHHVHRGKIIAGTVQIIF